MKRKFAEEFDISPMTYIMPDDYAKLAAERESDGKVIWILKPVASSCGRGIKLITKGSKVPKRQYVLI